MKYFPQPQTLLLLCGFILIFISVFLSTANLHALMMELLGFLFVGIALYTRDWI